MNVVPKELHPKKFPEMRVPPSFFEFMFDTTRAVATLIQYNIPERFPGIRFILSHAGGAAPYLTWKMSLTARYSGNDGGQAISHLQRFYYDTALSTSRYPLGLLEELAGTGQIVFGSDFPFAPEFVMASCLYELDHYDGLDADALRRIRATNAVELFPRFKV
jgi:predicted TIM-barrel fold metal-dependent hydrolase